MTNGRSAGNAPRTSFTCGLPEYLLPFGQTAPSRLGLFAAAAPIAGLKGKDLVHGLR